MDFVTLAQSGPALSLMERILDPSIMVFMIPITAILGGCAVTVTKTLVRHRERIAMIENGYDPDANVGVTRHPPVPSGTTTNDTKSTNRLRQRNHVHNTHTHSCDSSYSWFISVRTTWIEN